MFIMPLIYLHYYYSTVIVYSTCGIIELQLLFQKYSNTNKDVIPTCVNRKNQKRN